MEPIVKLKVLLETLLDYKETILQLPMDKKMYFSQALLTIYKACNDTSLGLKSGKEISPLNLDNKKIIADGLGAFSRRSYAEQTASSLFNVEDCAELNNLESDKKEIAADEIKELGLMYRKFIDACIASAT